MYKIAEYKQLTSLKYGWFSRVERATAAVSTVDNAFSVGCVRITYSLATFEFICT